MDIYLYMCIYIYIHIHIFEMRPDFQPENLWAVRCMFATRRVQSQKAEQKKNIYMDIYGYLWIFMVDLSKYLGFSIDVPGMYFFPDWLLETWSKKRRVSGEARKTIGFPRCFPRAIIGVGNHGFYQRNHVGNHGFSHFWMGFPTWFLW